ncbi:MAG: class I SAM-dependent methyltransferase [Bacteroidota bacterium]
MRTTTAEPKTTSRPTATVSGTGAPQSRLSDRPRPDLEAIKTRQQATWSSGDYGHIGVRLQIVGESLCEAVDLHAHERVLDVAAGNGNASLAAARRFADVIATDYVPELLEQARRRADADRLPITFQVADVEGLPFADGLFDVVLSTYGVMFTANQERAAAQLLRVVRPGGRIGLANWTPEGFIGQLFKVVGSFVPPPAGLRSPLQWGTEPRLVELFGPEASDIRTERKNYVFRFASAEHFIDYFRKNYGPIHKAFAGLDGEGQKAFHAALLELLNRSNQGGPGTLVVPSEYLEVVITK